jgi:transposase-like protein
VRAARVDDRREGCRFSSALLPADTCTSTTVIEVLPILSGRGLFPAGTLDRRLHLSFGAFFGTEAGPATSTVDRLVEAWQAERAQWSTRNLSGVHSVSLSADGVRFNIRHEEDRLCCVAIVAARPDGTRELVALADGWRESTDSWAEVLRGLRDRGPQEPVRAVGDRAVGFSGALQEVFPGITEQRYRLHVTRNGLEPCPRGGTPRRRRHSRPSPPPRPAQGPRGRTGVAEKSSASEKAVSKITGQLDVLLAQDDFPFEHWVHLRTTNSRGSTFSTLHPRTRVTRGSGSRPAALAMADTLLDSAHARWCTITCGELTALVRAGATSTNGKL